jgi:hypothetical protein
MRFDCVVSVESLLLALAGEVSIGDLLKANNSLFDHDERPSLLILHHPSYKYLSATTITLQNFTNHSTCPVLQNVSILMP